MTLSFLALSVIPSLKITDRGLVDVDAFRLVPLALDDDAAPTPGGAAPTHSDAAPTHSDAGPTHSDAAPTHGDAAPTHGDAAPTHGDAAPTHGDDAPTHGDAAPTHGDAAPTHGDAAPTHDGHIVLPRGDFVARFGGLFESSPWVAEAAWRPEGFADAEELHGALAAAMYAAPEERRIELIRAHPELGERAFTAASRSEQSGAGLDRLPPEERERLSALNAAYRERFGFPFVICVREHTRASILANADARLGNSPEREVETALAEIAKIARLRLEDAL
jgi:2-oxo-4-hydroxy-4-carboxy-5-ureidoimidazoline decarboxylase